MSDQSALMVQLLPASGDDPAVVEDLTALLREELLELDIAGAEPVETPAPDDSKGLGAAGAWLAVHLGPTALRAVANTIAQWAARNHKSVELSIGGDSLKLSGVNPDQMDRALDEFFA